MYKIHNQMLLALLLFNLCITIILIIIYSCSVICNLLLIPIIINYYVVWAVLLVIQLKYMLQKMV